MKLSLASTLLASSISTSTGSLRNQADESLSTIRRDLSISSVSKQSDITAVLKQRRASKNNNGKIVHNLKNKLESAKLRKLTEQQTNEMDLGALSRDLQQDGGGLGNTTSTTEADTGSVIKDLYALCTSNVTDPEFSCTCSNLDLDGYTATVSCAYAETCLEPTANSCKENKTFCFVETYNLNVEAPGTGSSSICYNVNTPTNFSYCYGLTYTEASEAPAGCFLELDGTKCNTCEFSSSTDNPNTTCNDFDCSNIDTTVGEGKICGDATIVSKKIEDYLTYASLPCEGGCNICPLGGEMANLDSNVTMVTGDTYYCYQLNLAALLGYLENVPGDLCNSLPEVVNQPCGCVGGDEPPPTTTAAPVVADGDTTSEPPASDPVTTGDTATVVNPSPAESPDPAPAESESTTPADPASSGALSSNYLIAVAVALASTIGWVIV